MTEIHLMASGHALWDEVTALAEACFWWAGPFLAEKMRRGEFRGWERVCAARVDVRVAGFCTLTEKDELPGRYGFSPFIGFLFVDERYRGNRLSERMIRQAGVYARGLGYEKLYVMSGETGLYEKYGFVKMGGYETIYGSVEQLFVKPL